MAKTAFPIIVLWEENQDFKPAEAWRFIEYMQAKYPELYISYSSGIKDCYAVLGVKETPAREVK